MAEAHPVGFQWVMEAKKRGATVIHVDPRFTRTSAVADMHVPIRAGSDIAFLGALVNHVLSNDLDFREYVVAYTNAANIIDEEFRGHRGPRRAVLRLRPRDRPLRPGHLALRRRPRTRTPRNANAPRSSSRTSGSPAAASTRSRTRPRARRATAPAVPRSAGRARRDETLQDPRCVFQILKRHFARYTPEMVAGGVRHQARAVPRGGRGADQQQRSRAHDRASATPSAGPTTASARR